VATACTQGKAPAGDKAWSLAATTERWLSEKSRRYDIVHFAGHALFAEGPEQDARGYLVFSGFPKPEAVPISIVASWLADAGVQLVYLSCCQSSASSAALEFARNSIPMAIGFHWDLDDSKAPVFAKQFYEELLKAKLKVCPAVSKARLELYNKHLAGDPIWASPILIAQPMNWIQVEGVLKLAANKRPDRAKSRRTPASRNPSARRPGAHAA
jgi:CHAT domain-containing protein